MTTPTFANSVDPDQMASEEAIWSGSTLFVIQFVNLNEKHYIYDVIWLAKWVWPRARENVGFSVLNRFSYFWTDFD